MSIRRLLRMGVPELAFRGRQEVSKWAERFGPAARRASGPENIFEKLSQEPTLESLRFSVPSGDLAGGARGLLDHFRQVTSERFFEGAVSKETAALLTERMPETRQRTIALADAACRARFDLLGYSEVSFGDPVDWHLDPISRRRASLVHWSQLDPLDFKAVGDSKVIWELNRHQWLVHLGQAYLLTGDERYAETFVAHVRDWVLANPPGFGINWASSLELALRLISWCWALVIFRDSSALTPQSFVIMLSSICAQASHIERYRSDYFSPNTHLTGEALGLFYAGVVFPEFRAADRWRTLGSRILREQIERQVFPDGVYFELSTCYQRYTVEIYLHFLILASRNGIAVDPNVAESVQRMLDFLLTIRRPDGSIPQIGDADGGWLLPFAPAGTEDYHGIFSTAAAFFQQSRYAWAAEHLASDTLWLLGPRGVEAFDTIHPAPPTTSCSRSFPNGGFTVMRNGWDADAHHLVFDVGPLGCSISGGHGHADLLSIQCAAFGEPYVIDPGTYCYTQDRDWRDFFRGTAAHSTLTIDGHGQAVPSGPFSWKSRPRARLRRWLSTATYDFADAEHNAYSTLPDPVAHRRRVLFIKPRYWIILDDLEGAAEHQVDLRFQLGRVAVALDEQPWVRVRGVSGTSLLIRAFATVPLKIEVSDGALEPIQGWVSPNFGQREPAPLLRYTAVTRLPLRILTLFLPTRNPSALPPIVSPLPGDRRGPRGIVFDEYEESISFDEQGFVLDAQAVEPPREDLPPDASCQTDAEITVHTHSTRARAPREPAR